MYMKEFGPTIVIDYAHTAEAIQHMLQIAKECGVKRFIISLVSKVDEIQPKGLKWLKYHRNIVMFRF
ncbi:hypothetical protein [Peribacillus aracenensis]|uniref:hypothetical protein n=1 Tax=Peribacillus aracenensis TaxID=2976708 RepID=UPI0037CB3891